MTRPPTILGALFGSRWVARAPLRRGICAVLALVLAILSLWPRPYQASALLAPDDTAAGLTGLFSGVTGANIISSLLGGRGTIEGDLLVGRSNMVFSAVAQKLHDQGRYPSMSSERLQARLHRKVEVESARGSILRISIEDHDPDLARQIVANFVVALQQRLTTLSKDQAEAKKKIVNARMEDAVQLLEQAQRALNDYRASHNFSTPEIQQAFSQGSLIALQGQLQSAQLILNTLESTAGPDNVQLQTVRDRIQVLQRQIATVESRQSPGSIQSLAKVNPEVSKFRDLLRDEGFAQGRYDIYKRFLESLTVQDVAAPLSVAVIDPPFVDPQRHFNALPLGLLALLIVAAIFAEIYLAPVPRLDTGYRSSALSDHDRPRPAPGSSQRDRYEPVE